MDCSVICLRSLYVVFYELCWSELQQRCCYRHEGSHGFMPPGAGGPTHLKTPGPVTGEPACNPLPPSERETNGPSWPAKGRGHPLVEPALIPPTCDARPLARPCAVA